PSTVTLATAVAGECLSGRTGLAKRRVCRSAVRVTASRSPRRRLATSALACVALLTLPPPLKVKTPAVLVGVQLVRFHPRDAHLAVLHGVRQRHEGRDAVVMQPLAEPYVHRAITGREDVNRRRLERLERQVDALTTA